MAINLAGLNLEDNFSSQLLRRAQLLPGINRPTWKGKVSSEDYERIQDPNFPLRAFFNWAKGCAMLKGKLAVRPRIQNGFVGLDYGCGKGGHLKKWHICGASFVYHVEEDEKEFAECKIRYTSMKTGKAWKNIFQAQFINDTLTSGHLNIPMEKVELITCHMAINKVFDCEKNARAMAKTIFGILSKGGCIVVCIINADMLEKKLRNSSTGKSAGNGVYSVKIETPLGNNFQKYGVKYTLTMGDRTFQEYVVPRGLLLKVMADVGLNLEINYTFPKLYSMGLTDASQVRTMQQMGVLKYKVNRDVGEEELCLTLNDQQQEAATFYETLIFKKI